MQPWEQLSESMKESNRQQADDVPRKLSRIGCGFAPVTDRKPALFKFTPQEIEIRAEMEHERWVKERLLAGWTYGKERNVERKISPHLVPWNELDDEVKQYDRDAVGGMPLYMADAKFEIYRLKKLVAKTPGHEVLK